MGWHQHTSSFPYIFSKTHPTQVNVPSLSLSSLSFQPRFCENTQRRRTHFFADASLWDTRIVGPPDHDPRSDPSNKVAQAPSSRCRDLIKNKWPTWVPQSQKRKYPFFFFLTTAAPFFFLSHYRCPFLAAGWWTKQGPPHTGPPSLWSPRCVRPDERTRSVIWSSRGPHLTYNPPRFGSGTCFRFVISESWVDWVTA